MTLTNEGIHEDKILIKEKYGLGKIQSFLSQQASRLNLWIVGGTIPIASERADKIRAACLVYDNQGLCVARYDKIHLFNATISATEVYQESATTEPGNAFVVVDSPVGKLGLSVCYDIRFPTLFVKLSQLGAEVIAIPAAFTVTTGEAHWQLLARSRAVENGCYLLGACQGGSHAGGRKTYGHSLIVDPWGRVMQEVKQSGNAVLTSPIDLDYLYQIRSSLRNHPSNSAPPSDMPMCTRDRSEGEGSSLNR